MNINDAWGKLFDDLNIVEEVMTNGFYTISSKEINKVKEARLMAKFDQSSQLPEVFKKNNFSILPITRGEYIIGPFSTHLKIDYTRSKPTSVEIPNLQTLDSTNLYSESSALLFAYNSGIIQDIMGNSKVNFTVNGRMSSGNFDFDIADIIRGRKQRIQVRNAQIEIDAGYESSDNFLICEAKNIAAEEILIRQLYYPFRLWKSKISKPIIPAFFVFSNDVFHAFVYKFEDTQYYNSIKLLTHKTYMFAEDVITLDDIIDVWKNTEDKPEPRFPFPQADSFERVIDLLSVLYNNELTRDEVTLKYEFDTRQTSYYISACEYLGLIVRTENENRERVYKLSHEAQKIMRLRYKAKYLALVRKVLECPIFNKAFKVAIMSGSVPEREEICKIMLNAKLHINTITIERRSSTVRGWLDWIFRLASAE